MQLTAGEDPFKRAARIQHMWCVEKRVQASVPAGGKLVRANPLTVQPGDLVDVAVSVQAVSMQARGGRRTEVLFVPLHVVLLKKAHEMEVSVHLWFSLMRAGLTCRRSLQLPCMQLSRLRRTGRSTSMNSRQDSRLGGSPTRCRRRLDPNHACVYCQ